MYGSAIAVALRDSLLAEWAAPLGEGMAFESKELLKPPIARAAYSDRSAWMFAEMSRLAYEKFESPAELLDTLAEKLAALEDRSRIKDEVARFVRDWLVPSGSGLATLKSSLAEADFQLVETFNNGGTQAFLAKRDLDRVAVLAFRGTEKDFGDIRTDLDARFYEVGGVKTHNGFQKAFEQVEPIVRRAVSSLHGYSLYVTGHSLGGALALVATRTLNADNIAACYTYGSPKVGNEEFGAAIKPPIYRVVNAADAVPRVPPTWAIEFVIFASRFLPVPYLRAFLVRFLESFRGYRHHGDMRFLTPCKDDFDGLKLLSNPDIFDRARWLVQRLSVNLKFAALDHGIAEYCKKLERYAISRIGPK